MKQPEKLLIEAGELASHDWQRTLCIRKPMGIGYDGALAIVAGTDVWHPSAFKGTGVEHLIPKVDGPPARMFHLIDWCGNPVGQIEDCPFGPVGRIYEVQKLGLAYAFYELVSYTAEMDSGYKWHWRLCFAYTDKCKELASAAYKASRT